MSQRNNDNRKRQKPKENQLGIFKKFTHFAGKFSKRPGFQERGRAAGVTYLSMRVHPKSCHIFPPRVATALLSGSRKGTIRG